MNLRLFALGLMLTMPAVVVSAQSHATTPPTPPAASSAPGFVPATTQAPTQFPGQATAPANAGPAQAPQAMRAQVNRAAMVETRSGLRLRFETDFGSVRIYTDSTDSVRYVIHVEPTERDADPQSLLREFMVRAEQTPAGVLITGRTRGDARERLKATYELHVPHSYNLEVTTQVGNIQVDDIDGRVNLITGGGNISTGRVNGGARQAGGPAAVLESRGGGHIIVGDVVGDLHAMTVGGHITTGNISGDAVLNTGGGHIHAGTIGGVAQLQTGGGNISVERAGGHVTASSGGGQINFGEAAGAIQAHTTGGGVRVLRVSGPTQLDSNGGSIFLTKIEKPIHASTGNGSITAWLDPSLKDEGGSQLESGGGDIVLYVPRRLQITIQATIEGGPAHRIVADPALPMKISYITGDSGKQEIGQCAINGGGDVIHLKTLQGNIQLRYTDQAFLRQQEMIEQQTQQEINAQLKTIQASVAQSMAEFNNQMFVLRMPTSPTAAIPATSPPGGAAPAAPSVNAPPAETLWLKLGEYMWGGVTIDAAEEEKLRVQQVRPVYPPVARQAGIEGTVSMRILIDQNGKVTRVEPLSGESILQQAAVRAVRQWQYRPYVLNGQTVPAVTVVNVEFQLH